MANVVPKKSRLELEKEASIKRQMEEKENEIKKAGLRGALIKFDMADSHISSHEADELKQRGSISPGRKQRNSIGLVSRK